MGEAIEAISAGQGTDEESSSSASSGSTTHKEPSNLIESYPDPNANVYLTLIQSSINYVLT